MGAVRILSAVLCMAVAGTAWAGAEGGRLVLEALQQPAASADESGVTDRRLFEMCCWARGRSGFNHCTEYGVCVNDPEAVCRGRGAAAGMQLGCETEPKGNGGENRQAGRETEGD